MFNIWKHKRNAKRDVNIKNGYLDKKQGFYKPLLLLAPALVFIIIFTIIPFIYSASNAFDVLPNKHDKTVTKFGVDNWDELLNNPFFVGSLKTSMLYSFLSVPIVITVSALISAVLAHIGRKWLRGIFQTIFFLPYVTSAVAISLAFAYFFDLDSGLLNKMTGERTPWLVGKRTDNHALYAMLMYGTWRGIAFNVLIFTTAMLGVDKTLYKSASLDGAGPIRQFFSITLPSINRTINFLLTMGIIGAIKVFPLALFNNNTTNAMNHGGGTLLLFVYDAVKVGNIQVAAVSSIMLLIISISFSVVFRNSITGVIKLANYIGDKHVSNKIKTQIMIR